MQTVPVIDTHQHLWDLEQFCLPWLAHGGPLAKTHTMDHYLETAAGLNVTGTVYMEVDVTPDQHIAEAESVIALCQRDDNPMLGAVIGGRPASKDFRSYLRLFQNDPYIKGVRQVLHGGTPKGFCLEPAFVRGVQLLGEFDLCFDICIRPDELDDAARLADLCPETRLVLDHCGNAPVDGTDLTSWCRDIAEVARRENVVCKISGIVAGAQPGKWTPGQLAPIVRHCLSEFGMERVMFGGDWPVCTLAATFQQWVEALGCIVQELPEGDQRKLFHDNAVRFYCLDAKD